MRVTLETKQATRARILNVAQPLFAQRGFEATTTRDIAHAAGIAAGTLFNYFPTKESIVYSLVGDAWSRASQSYAAALIPTVAMENAHGEKAAAPVETSLGDVVGRQSGLLSLEEELFAHVAAVLWKLKPYRKYLPAVLETSLSPAAQDRTGDEPSLRCLHLEVVTQIVSRHGRHEVLSSVALHLYWTLLTGVLAYWAQDGSPHQEDTLAVVDQSLSMFVGWLTSQATTSSESEVAGQAIPCQTQPHGKRG
jgi:AcrR family transcriptional regulator